MRLKTNTFIYLSVCVCVEKVNKYFTTLSPARLQFLYAAMVTLIAPAAAAASQTVRVMRLLALTIHLSIHPFIYLSDDCPAIWQPFDFLASEVKKVKFK